MESYEQEKCRSWTKVECKTQTGASSGYLAGFVYAYNRNLDKLSFKYFMGEGFHLGLMLKLDI